MQTGTDTSGLQFPVNQKQPVYEKNIDYSSTLH